MDQTIFPVRAQLFGQPETDYRWQPQFLEPWLNRLRTRLQTLRKYRIKSREKIRRLLVTRIADAR